MQAIIKKGNYFVLVFYPADFTFVCPTELRAFSEKAEDFRKLNCELAMCSTDSEHVHWKWISTPKEQGGLGPMNIPVVADRSQKICRSYGILPDDGYALRATFIIDTKNIIRHVSVNDGSVGRSVEEVLRLVEAFQYCDKHGEVCPAGWKKGKKTMKPTQDGLKEFVTEDPK